MPREVVITTGARLHFGLLAVGQGTGRQFGGAGAMVDLPGFVVRGRIAERDEYAGPAEWRTRVEQSLNQYRSAVKAGTAFPKVRIEIDRAIPAHAGLGSGTQLGMAVGQALAILTGDDAPHPEIARRVGRGLRSALGIHGFRHGGFLVEAGKQAGEVVSPLVAHVAFPMNWRFVLVRPPGTEGLSGSEELSGFSELPPMPVPVTERLCRIALVEMLPAVMEADFDGFANALGDFGRIVGEYFSAVQGGVFANPLMARLAAELVRRGVAGVGQTSWGPTIFVPCQDESAARALVTDIGGLREFGACECFITSPRNQGASVEILA